MHIAGIKKNQYLLSSKSKFYFLCVSKPSNDTKLFIAKVIARDIPNLKDIDSILSSYFNKINFENHLDIIILLVPLIITQNLQEDLCNIIKLTKSSDSINLAALNAIFILNRADFEFRNLDFSRTDISGANLSECLFFNVNFEYSNLKAVNFTQSKFYNCNFRKCDLRDALFSNCILLGKHKKFIKIVKISKNDDFLLTCSKNCANLWNLKESTFLKTLYINIQYAEFSPCGNFIAFRGCDLLLWIWDIKNKVKPKKVHDQVTSFAFSPCGKYIAFSHWDFVQLNCSKHLRIRNKWKVKNFSNLTFTKCGKFIVCISDGIIKQLSIINETVENFYIPSNIISRFFFSPSHKYFYLACDDGFSIMSSKTKELKFVSKWCPSKDLWGISWSPYEDKIALSNLDGISILDVEKQMIIAQIRSSIWRSWKKCWPVCFTKCGKYIIVGWNDGRIKQWALETQKFQKKIELTNNITTSAAFSSCENYLYRVTNCGNIDRYDIINKHSENWIKGSGNYHDGLATFSRCRKYVAVEQNPRSFVIWNLETKKIFGNFKTNLTSKCKLLNFSGSGKLLLSIYWKKIVIWNLEQKNPASIIDCITDILAISPNDKYLASSPPYNRSIKIWEFNQDYKKIQKWKYVENKPVRSLLFSDCSNFLYSGDYAGKVEIWDFKKAEKIREFGMCHQSAELMAIRPRGLIIKTSRKVFLYDPDKGEKIKEARACRDKNFCTNFYGLQSFSITKSGEWILSKGNHKAVGLWELI